MLSGDEMARRMQLSLDYAGNTHSIADVVRMVSEGAAQCWHNGDGCIITEVHDYPLRKAVHYWLISGELRHCLALEHDVNAWAVERGCTVATAAGRAGWGRVAAKTGWRPFMPMFVKTLVETNHGR